MLVLMRKVGQSVTLELPSGDEIKVTLTSIGGNKVRIGFVAPDNVIILRDELRGCHGDEKGINTGTDHADAEGASTGDGVADGLHHAGAGGIRA